MVDQCFEVADYAIEKFQSIGWNAWRNPASITVVIDRPSMYLIEKWQLAVNKNIAHLVMMPHVTKERVDRFVCELQSEIDSQRAGGI